MGERPVYIVIAWLFVFLFVIFLCVHNNRRARMRSALPYVMTQHLLYTQTTRWGAEPPGDYPNTILALRFDVIYLI